MPQTRVNKRLTSDADRRSPKRPDSAGNARPAVKFVTHGGSSALLSDRIDLRTREGRAYVQYKGALVQHMGGDTAISVPQRLLVDQAAKLQLLVGLAWHELNRVPPFRKDGSIAPAFDALIRAQRELRSLLETLGLKRHTKELSLSDYLAGRGEGDNVFGDDDENG